MYKIQWFDQYFMVLDSVNLDKNDPVWSKNMSLRVNGTGHVLHAFVNGEYIGTLYVLILRSSPSKIYNWS